MKKKTTKRQSNNDELRRLDSEIGSFGIEPPKIYRPEQRAAQEQGRGRRQPKKQVRQPRAKKSENLTNDQRHSINTKKRKQKKKIRRIASYTAIGISLVIVAIIMLVTLGFKIDNIKINNCESSRYTSEQILAVLPIEKEKKLLLTDTKAAEEKLEKSLPYIYDAQIKRKLPSTVVVTIIQPEYIYYVKNADKTYTLMDDNFKVLEVGVKKRPDGIRIKKLALEAAVAGERAVFTDDRLESEISVLTGAVRDYRLKEITALYSEGAGANYLVYDNRIVIKLGDSSNIENKIYSALTALEKLNESNPSAEGVLTSTGGKQVYFTENK